ncbi:ABC transporter permease [soil metagenome]
MTSPGWMRWLLARLAAPGEADDVVGDLEETYRARAARHGRLQTNMRTAVDAMDMAFALVRLRLHRRRESRRGAGAPAGSREVERRPTVFSWIDVTLGFRLLARYPGLTIVGGAAMAFAIAVGAGAFEAVKQLVDPVLPLPGGDRIVALRQWDAQAGSVHGQTLHDFVEWREELKSVEHLGAYRSVDRNLIIPGGGSEPVYMAEISASAFRVAGVAPQLGRFLLATDEEPGAPDVVVISHDVWRTRFGSDPSVVGRTVRVGRTEATVAGVMPEGFAFPVAHELWAPLQLNALHYARGTGPQIATFGRLADGATLEQAQAELTTIGARTAARLPITHEHLRPQVMPFAQSIIMLDIPPQFQPLFYAANVFFVMLLVLICANVALLMFARAATRESEIVVRTALGASRWRIITQLFTEALVLGSVAALVGIAAAHLVLETWLAVAVIEGGGRLPFWFHDRLAPLTIVYAVGLTVLGAAIAGIVPALKMTGRGVEANLRQLAGGGLRFGNVWTTIIVTQVALTVAFPATAFFTRQYVVGVQTVGVGFNDEEYLSLRLEFDRESAAGDGAEMSPAEFAVRFNATYSQFAERLEDEASITGVAFADRLPRTHHSSRPMEVHDPAATAPQHAEPTRISTAAVGIDYFDVLGTPVLAGRAFRAADLDADTRVVVVNQSFVERMFQGRNAIGRMVRYAPPAGREPGPWHEIIGVVPDIGMLDDVSRGAGLYYPAMPATAYPVHMLMHVRGEPQSLQPRLRAIAASVDPGLRIHDIIPLREVGATMWLEMDFIYRLLLGISAVALLLSLAGIYAVMSFTVSRRTREIGVRVALGATTLEVATAIFRRPLRQVGYGILAGSALTAALALGIAQGVSIKGVVLVFGYAALMMGICMLACIVPTRRALGIEPSRALSSEA